MLLLIDNYKEAYPNRDLTVLEKFRSQPKNLHEMSIAEINDITKGWDALASQTTKRHKNAIKYYLNWLQSQGVACNPTIADKITLPTKKEEYLIYSTQDLNHYFDELYKSTEIDSARSGETNGREQFYVIHAVCVLSFYGLTIEQILALDLSDVQPDGVLGYSLPLTKDDIDVLLRYKNLTSVGRGRKLKGTKYVRGFQDDGAVCKDDIGNPLRRHVFSEEYNYLKKLLTYPNVYTLGVFNRMYEAEKASGDMLLANKRIFPAWFKGITEPMRLSVNTLTVYKREYMQYREERNNAGESVSEMPVVANQVVCEEEPKVGVDVAALSARLNNALKAMQTICAEIEDIQKQLNELKM